MYVPIHWNPFAKPSSEHGSISYLSACVHTLFLMHLQRSKRQDNTVLFSNSCSMYYKYCTYTYQSKSQLVCLYVTVNLVDVAILYRHKLFQGLPYQTVAY